MGFCLTILLCRDHYWQYYKYYFILPIYTNGNVSELADIRKAN